MYNYGKIVKSFTITCAACGKENTFSNQTLIDGKPHCYKGTAELSFQIWYAWNKRNNCWLCYDCTLDYDGGDLKILEIIKDNIK